MKARNKAIYYGGDNRKNNASSIQSTICFKLNKPKLLL